MKEVKNKLGKDYWRSVDQLADTPEFQERLHREFPVGADELSNPISRRSFISIMGASIGLAWLTGCRRPIEEIIPYVNPPEEIVLGKAIQYATTMPLGNQNYGLLVTSREGRPIKIEGNPLHPSSKGGTNAIIQASILGLYDPDRSGRVLEKGEVRSWADFQKWWQPLNDTFTESMGTGLAVISETFASPSMQRMKDEFKAKYPNAAFVEWDPISNENHINGNWLAFGKALVAQYDYAKAKVILSLDSDFMLNESDNVTNSLGFADGRRIKSEKDDMNRLYVVESSYTITGAMADHRVRMNASKVASFVATLTMELFNQGLDVSVDGLSKHVSKDFDAKFITELAKDLIANKGAALVSAGWRQPIPVHAQVCAINKALGAIGATVNYIEPIDNGISSTEQLARVVQFMKGQAIDTVVILGGNPVYNAPADFEFENALKNVRNKIHLSLYNDETSKNCSWHLPMAHFLEAWGDARHISGHVSVVQPMIAPLLNGKSTLEVMNILIHGEEVSGYEIVRKSWEKFLTAASFEKAWRRVLHDGIFESEATPFTAFNMHPDIMDSGWNNIPVSNGEMELAFAPDNTLYDGRFANNGWLQELPDPITKIVWENAAYISPNTADKMNLKEGDIVNIAIGNNKIEIPVWIVPGHSDNALTLPLGYGRKDLGRVADGAGVNSYPLRNSANLGFVQGVKIASTGLNVKLATTQDHHSLEGRPFIREATLDQYRDNPMLFDEMVHVPKLQSLWKEHTYDDGYQWGMSIDLNTCIGCNACTIACQSENNIPIVGKKEADYGREMHWIRLDRYFNGDLDDPQMVTQPVGCQHCEMAPCEQVCPVAATVHDSEGLNVMVYNRCVGTRYCSNNCPYKVRRFNFYNYTNKLHSLIQMAQNPDVTVRSRGVMEKCTYCIQRINRGKASAKLDGRELRDGEIVTACQSACPTNAITFGNIRDENSAVSQMKKQNRNYQMLAEFNTRPRTSYLARVRNPNPALVSA